MNYIICTNFAPKGKNKKVAQIAPFWTLLSKNFGKKFISLFNYNFFGSFLFELQIWDVRKFSPNIRYALFSNIQEQYQKLQ